MWIKRTENNGDNRETVNPSFILAHPLDLHFLHEWSNWTEINAVNGNYVSFMTKLAKIVTKIFI